MNDFGGDHGDMARSFYGQSESEYPKRVICPRCDSTKLFSKFTINTLTGYETEEVLPCEDCDEEGRIWVFDSKDERKLREVA